MQSRWYFLPVGLNNRPVPVQKFYIHLGALWWVCSRGVDPNPSDPDRYFGKKRSAADLVLLMIGNQVRFYQRVELGSSFTKDSNVCPGLAKGWIRILFYQNVGFGSGITSGLDPDIIITLKSTFFITLRP